MVSGGDTLPVLLGWLCGCPLPPTFLFQGGAAAVFGFVVQALDLLLPGLHVFVHEMKDGWVSQLSTPLACLLQPTGDLSVSG